MEISTFGMLFITLGLIGLPIIVLVIANKVVGSYSRVKKAGTEQTSEMVSFNLSN